MSAISQKPQVLLGKLAMVHMSVMHMSGRLRQKDCCELETGLGYRVSSPLASIKSYKSN